LYYFPNPALHGRLKDRPIVNKRVKLTVFATRIGIGWQVAKEAFVQFPSGKTGGQDSRIDAGCSRTKAEF
jgi:hypothetical protein